MARLDIELDGLLARMKLHARFPEEAAYSIDPALKLSVSIQFNGDIAGIRTDGLELSDMTGQVTSGTVTLSALVTLAGNPNVISIEKQRPNVIQLDDSIPDIQADQVWSRVGNHFSGYSGLDVIVGIIDTGIDFRHKNFRKPDGTTRILKIWDQTINAPVNPPQGGETVPGAIANPATLATPLGYGVVYDTGQINDTLTSESPVLLVRHKDDDGHGTHVAGIAAGNGSQSGGCHGDFHYIGVAPRADLVIVRLWGLSDGDKGEKMTPPASPPVSAPSGSTVLDALKFILNEALNQTKPVVINCSFGLFSELIDGSDSTSQGVNTLLAAHSTGTSVVWAAGNDGNANFHAVGTVAASGGAIFNLEFKIFRNDNEERYLAITYNGSNLDVQVISPVGGANGTVAWVSSGASGSSNTANGPAPTGGTAGSVIVTNNANRIGISITPPKNAPVGSNPATNANNVANTATAKWKIELRNTTATPTPVDAFCLYGSSHDRKSPHFLNNTTSNTTLTQQASGRECVTVGSYVVGGQLAASSGRGPTLNNPPRTKPEIAAPGVDITSCGIPKDREGDTCANCCCECCQDHYVGKGGTSMAAPHIAGLIALILHKNPGLTHTQIKALLTANFNARPGDAPPADVVGWGAGKASAQKAVGATTQVNPPVAMVATQAEISQPLLVRFLSTDFGKIYYALGQKYFGEILSLINTNKRVATAWHRSRGPIWTRLALKAFYNPEAEIPIKIHGMHIRESVDVFIDMLKKYASLELREDIERCLPCVSLVNEGMTLSELMLVLGNHPVPVKESMYLEY